MCLAEKRFFFILVLFLFWLCLADVLQAEEQETWYLISETELRSIEQYKEKSEAEKRNWLLQVQELKRDSANSNALLAQAREQNRKLEQSFNGYEADRLTQLSLKNGEIEELKQQLADKTLEAEKWKGCATSQLIIIIAAAVIVVLYVAFKVCRFLRPI